ncbi:hypothetical protein OG599_22575 [Streptomyces sp. NBC_01335]|uniref:hypothetical protein n=1 Tax=Streptomyces sp. NBC_01335 TaxID=2903828 RepID=UPI002E15AE1D|nr:hypothetical protein OG599_22575 [Streptomyces sp. NBC_01335]
MTLTRGARITGTVLSAVLALINVGWIVRDLRVLDGPGPLWDFWSGTPESFPTGIPATTGGTLVLLLVQVVTAFVVPRSPSAAGALVATGAATLLLRLPGVWTTTSSWMGGYSDELRLRATICTVVTLAAAIAMIVTASAGRRPAEEVGLLAPGRPTAGAAVVAFLALGASGVVVIAWEIRQFFVFPDEFYPDWYIGGRVGGSTLVDPPGGWSTVTVAVLALFAAVSALARGAHSRPFAMVAAPFLLLSGVLGIARGIRLDLFGAFVDAGIEEQLTIATWVFLPLAGIVALLVAALPGRPDAEGRPGQGWGPGTPGYGHPPLAPPGRAPGYGYPYPSSAPGSPYEGGAGYGYPSAGQGAGYGYPSAGQNPAQSPAQDPAAGSGGPGYGPPPGGGFGPPPSSLPPPSSPPPGSPPPPSSPPPGW